MPGAMILNQSTQTQNVQLPPDQCLLRKTAEASAMENPAEYGVIYLLNRIEQTVRHGDREIALTRRKNSS